MEMQVLHCCTLLLKQQFLFYFVFEILQIVFWKYSFAHFCHDSNVSHFYPHTQKRQVDVKRGSLSFIDVK